VTCTDAPRARSELRSAASIRFRTGRLGHQTIMGSPGGLLLAVRATWALLLRPGLVEGDQLRDGNPGAGHDPLRRASCRMCSHRPRKPEEPYALWTNHVAHAPRKRAAPKTVIHREVITGDHDRSRTRQPQWPILRSLGVSGAVRNSSPTQVAKVWHLKRALTERAGPATDGWPVTDEQGVILVRREGDQLRRSRWESIRPLGGPRRSGGVARRQRRLQLRWAYRSAVLGHWL
jgi:hypothetical protein